jgi:hypothetical protein
MTPLPVGSPAARLDRAGAAIRRRLADAPVGGYALLEAAFAGQRLRPGPAVQAASVIAGRPAGMSGAGPPPPGRPQPRHLPIVQTDREEVAARVARLLSGLAWAIVTKPGSDRLVRVEVPRAVYHRVARALSGAWRDARRAFEARTAQVEPGAAVALWRMAMLADGIGPQRDMVYLRAGTPALAALLVSAAEGVGLAPVVEHVRGGPAVVLCHPGEVHWLLAEAGAGDLARLWATTAG